MLCCNSSEMAELNELAKLGHDILEETDTCL